MKVKHRNHKSVKSRKKIVKIDKIRSEITLCLLYHHNKENIELNNNEHRCTCSHCLFLIVLIHVINIDTLNKVHIV